METFRGDQGRADDILFLCHISMVGKVPCFIPCEHKVSLTYISENTLAEVLYQI